jgi:hypothetical protein
MNRALRRRHLAMTSVLAILVLAVLAFAISVRRHVPPSQIPAALLRDRTP